MLVNNLTFHAPKTIDELREIYSSVDHVKLQAGGTFLLNQLKLLKRNGAKTAEHVITLQKIDELKGISIEGSDLIIKSMTTIDELFNSKLLDDNFSILKKVCRNISTQPIRNMASVGGNLTCRYTWTEMPAVMIGLGAQLHFITKEGKEETIDPVDFFKNAAKTDAILTHISIPRETDVNIAYRRVKKTQFVDIPMLSLLIKTKIEGGKFSETRVGINNCVDFAQRDEKLENFLNGKEATKGIEEEALKNLTDEIYDRRASEYKGQMFRLNVKEVIKELYNK